MKTKEKSQGNNSLLVKVNNSVNNTTVKISMAMAALNVVVLGINSALFYTALKASENNVYFQVDSEGRLVQAIPTDKPNQSIASVSSWLKDSLQNTFQINFYDYKESLSESLSLYFTEKGGEQLVQALKDSQSIANIEEKELWVSLVLDNPVFVKRGVRNGVYTWHFQVRGQLSKVNVSGAGTPDNVVFDIYVERMSESLREKGLGISRVVMDRI